MYQKKNAKTLQYKLSHTIYKHSYIFKSSKITLMGALHQKCIYVQNTNKYQITIISP